MNYHTSADVGVSNDDLQHESVTDKVADNVGDDVTVRPQN